VLLKRIPNGWYIFSRTRKPGDSCPLPYQAAGECPDIPSATWFQADDLLNHEPLRGVHAPEKRQHAIGIFLLQVIIDIERV